MSAVQSVLLYKYTYRLVQDCFQNYARTVGTPLTEGYRVLCTRVTQPVYFMSVQGSGHSKFQVYLGAPV